MATIAGEFDRPAAPEAEAASEYPPPRQAWYTVGILAVITTFALLDQNILGLLIQQIKTDFALTDSEAGLLLGPTQSIFYAFVAVPFSRCIDRWTRKWIIAGGLIIWSLATAASGLARVAERLEAGLADGRQWLLGDAYTLADIKWYSMVPGMQRMVPEICNPQATPGIAAWLGRMGARAAVQALEGYRPAPATSPA